MEFRVPFTYSTLDKLKKRSAFFKKFIKQKKGSKLADFLRKSDVNITREEYLAICLAGFVVVFIAAFIFSSTGLVIVGTSRPFLFALVIALFSGGFIFFSRMIYPKVFDMRRQKNIERNLIPALQDMLVQFNSGIPLFTILVNISSSDYGELSKEFKDIVKRINAGYSQMDVLEEVGEDNSSLFFRRALWQISNGMRAGGDISIVIEESIKSLADEQLIQIQVYGNKLNPAIMFYMLISVIIPALSITFMTVISSMVNISSFVTTMMFLGMFAFVMLAQIMFLGVIKSIRPSLM